MSVSDMKGKFIKPTLKKVSKYENKFAKLQEKAAKFAFANQARRFHIQKTFQKEYLNLKIMKNSFPLNFYANRLKF